MANNNDGSAEANSWRSQFQADLRVRIIRKMVDTLMVHLPAMKCPGALFALMKVVASFEERMYTSAPSQNDYLHKISMKLLTLETRNTIRSNVLQRCHPVPELHDGETSWQTQFPADYRLRIFNKILDTSRTHLPISSVKDLLEATQSAIMFEEQVYTSATDKSDYLSKIAKKLLSIEVNSENSDVAT